MFIATPDETHYKILRKIAILDKRIFCEKPISRKLKDLKIINNFKKNKLYISDISNFYPNINFKRKNLFLRTKFESNKKNYSSKRYDFLYRFAFHELGYIYKKLGPVKFKKIKIIESKKNLAFALVEKKMIFEFFYETSIKKKKYSLNGISFYNNKDILKKMIKNFINKKVDFKANTNKVIYVTKLIDKVEFNVDMGFVNYSYDSDQALYGIFIRDGKDEKVYHLFLIPKENNQLTAELQYNDGNTDEWVSLDHQTLSTSSYDLENINFKLIYENYKLKSYLDNSEIFSYGIVGFECKGYGIYTQNNYAIWVDNVAIYGKETSLSREKHIQFVVPRQQITSQPNIHSF